MKGDGVQKRSTGRRKRLQILNMNDGLSPSKSSWQVCGRVEPAKRADWHQQSTEEEEEPLCHLREL